jgi:hypothetical protein
MRTYVKRLRVPVHHRLGCRRSVPRLLARDEDLRIFLQLSRDSFRLTGREIDELIRPA